MHFLYFLLIGAQWALSVASIDPHIAASMSTDEQGNQLGERHEDHASQNPQSRSSKRVKKRQDDGTKFYIVAPTDYTDDAVTKDIDSYIRTQCKNPDDIRVHGMPGTSHTVFWGHVQLDEQGKENVGNYTGVEAIGTGGKVSKNRATLPRRGKSAALTALDDTESRATDKLQTLSQRDETLSWVLENISERDLPMVSQPKEWQDRDLLDFVREERAGAGIFIYVIDAGVQRSVKNPEVQPEFPNWDKTIQGTQSQEADENVDNDDDSTSHGSMVASKALGQHYGVAKGASLVVVKIKELGTDNDDDSDDSDDEDAEEFIEAFQNIVRDLNDNPDRVSKSVVLTSLSVANEYDDEKAMTPYIQQIIDLGVPIVAAAGNDPIEEDDDIRDLPMTLVESPEIPIINVGACDWDRVRADYSLGGPYLSLYAPGGTPDQKTNAQSKFDETPNSDFGTSYAAPLVAGVIATVMNYENPPWDTSKQGRDRSKAIRDAVVSDSDVLSWVRDQEVENAPQYERVIWNGATVADHKSVGANPISGSLAIVASSVESTAKVKRDNPTYEWLFFEWGAEQSLCDDRSTALATKEVPDSSQYTEYLGGTTTMQMGSESCEYDNSGGNAGRLFCTTSDGVVHPIECAFDPGWPDKGIATECADQLVLRGLGVLCSW